MKLSIIISIISMLVLNGCVPVPAPVQATKVSESEQKAIGTRWMACLTHAIKALDDHQSSADVIASAARADCSAEEYAYTKSFVDSSNLSPYGKQLLFRKAKHGNLDIVTGMVLSIRNKNK